MTDAVASWYFEEDVPIERSSAQFARLVVEAFEQRRHGTLSES